MAIEINNESSVEINEFSLIQLMQHAYTFLHIHPDAELSVVLVDEKAMEKLHIEWMDEPGATDVLSFPMDQLLPGVNAEDLSLGMLGDIVLCPQVAAVQAEVAGHAFEQELFLLTVHGFLHLLGFDHAEPDEKKVMFTLQGAILESFTPDIAES